MSHVQKKINSSFSQFLTLIEQIQNFFTPSSPIEVLHNISGTDEEQRKTLFSEQLY